MTEKNNKHGFWLKYLLSLFCGVLITLLVAWATVMFWLGPGYVKTNLTDDISAFWNGPVIVDGINFRLFHPITVDRITLENKMGKPCLQAKGVSLLLEKWPSRDPQLTGIKLDRLDVRIQFQEGGADWPFKKPTASSSDPQDSSAPLDNFTVDNLAIHVSNTKNTAMVLDDLSFSAVRKQKGYNLSLKQGSSSDVDNFSLSGNINPEDSQANFSLLLAKHITKKTAAEALSLFELPLPFECEASISANIMFAGSLDDYSDLQPSGTIIVTDGNILKDQTVWAEKLNASVQVNGPHVKVEKWTAESFSGQIAGTFEAKSEQKKLAQFQGQIQGKDIQVSGVMGTLTDTQKSSEGFLAFDYAFSADQGNLQQMKGHGSISLEQVDYHIMPVYDRIIRTISLRGSKAQRKSHAIGTLETAGAIVTFQKSRLANDWVAIETLPGGTLDLQTGRINVSVIVAPIKQIREVLDGIPVVKLFMHLKDQLTCLHVKGNRSDLSNIKITKEPLRDVTKGTLDFFHGVATLGYDFIKGTIDIPKTLLKNTKENNDKTNQ